ncbi:MAG TPA: acyl-CoA dehydrogenase family protein [Paucimonas sp.]|nr:acyl-CoA dehydrogenase family protein [Paucimonas sp.]HJW54525.1 acyl-CoA dehydrogenase family protein [Burkholderiaceae bacterium]
MHPWSNAELEMLRDTARRFFADAVTPHEKRWDAQQHVDRALWRQAGALGLLCASIPEAYGGAGGDFRHEAVLYEEQAHANNTSFGIQVHSGICAHYFLNYATETQKRRYLPQMASGEAVCAIAMTEPGAGSDLQAVATRAERHGDHYAINGAKTFISNGHLADLILLVAKTDTVQGAKGISLIVVETRDLPGFTRGRLLEKIGQHGQDTAELFFDDARVPVGNLLGEHEGQGFVQLMNQLPQERLIIGVCAVAFMEQAVELATQYAKQRRAFGKPLFDLQSVRFTLAECRTEARIARVFIDDCIAKHVRGELDNATASMAKWWCTQKQCEVIDKCLQLFGGYGYMMEYPIAKMYADARVQKIYGGANELMKELIARSM